MTIEKSIGWTDMTINPIKGMCQGGCWYCWTKGFYKRNFLQPKIRLKLTAFDDIPKSPKKIFLCSTHDLFGSWIPQRWRDEIFEDIRYYSQHTFQILTKFPQNIDRPMPDNVHLGVSITGEREVYDHYQGLLNAKAKIKFISFEPLFKPTYLPTRINWAIIGRLTGHGHKYDPPLSLLKIMVNTYKVNNIPIFLKNNLKPIWGDNLIQEMPQIG